MNGMAASDKIFALLDLPEPERGTEEIRKNARISGSGICGFPMRRIGRFCMG